jgi:transcriptional regulator with XRE-family HTH domain
MKQYFDKIKKTRDEKGYTQEFMANRLGISQNSYHKIESGKTKVTVQLLEKVAEIFEVDILKLMQEDRREIKIKQSSHDQSTGFLFHSKEDLDHERSLWKSTEKALLETIIALKEVIEVQKKAIAIIEKNNQS